MDLNYYDDGWGFCVFFIFYIYSVFIQKGGYLVGSFEYSPKVILFQPFINIYIKVLKSLEIQLHEQEGFDE